jgi:hypothetical protein
VALAVAGSGSPARAVTLTPTSQTRTLSISAQAITLDAQSNPIENDGDLVTDSAPDYSLFARSDSVDAATSMLVATSSASHTHSSEILTDAILVSGSQSGLAASNSDGTSSTNYTAFCRISFTVDQTADYSLTGTIDANPGTTASLYYSGPQGLIGNYQLDGTTTQHVTLNDMDTAGPGAYTFDFRMSGGTYTYRGGSNASSGAYDITLQFQGSAVDAPLPAPAATVVRAFPNPFRERTSIRTASPDGAPLRAVVLDVTGGVVRTLAPGAADLSWDGRAESGRRVPAGTYFVRLESPDGPTVVKITALR